jgi:hypothetical protein
MSTQLQSGLDDLRRKVIRAGASSGVAWAVFAGVVIVLGAMWLDLVVELPADLRVFCGVLALIGAAVLLVRIVRKAVGGATPAAIANKLDSAGQARGEIVSGVDLALHPTAGGAITTGLAAIAIERAAQLVRRVPASHVIPAKDTRKPLLWLVAVVVFVIGVVLIAPRLAATQWARFVDPYGDHPPYSSIAFAVEPGNVKVIYGGSQDITVKADGGNVDNVELVLVENGKPIDPLPMFPETNGQWRASLANITAPSQYFVRAGRARSSRYELGVITTPKLENVTFKVTLPAYTQRPPYEGPLPQGGLVGLPGTAVQVKAKSNRQLKGGTMTFSPSTQPAGMSPLGEKEVAGSFQITEAGKVNIGVTDVEGQSSTETLTAPITLLKDERPFVRLTEPRPNSFATPDAMMQIIAVAEDDFGVARLQIYRGLNDTRPRPMNVEVPTKTPTMFPAQMILPLADYGLRPGDVVKLFARVEDNDPAGPKGAESSIVTIHIISQEEFDQMVVQREGIEALESKYASVARRLETMGQKAQELADELAKLDPNSDLAAEKRKQLEELVQQMMQEAIEIEKSADKTLPLDLDKVLTKELDKAAKAMREAAEATKQAAAGKSGPAAKKMDEAAKKLGQERKDLKENAQDPIEDLAKVLPLIEAEQRFIELAGQQRELADRMSALEADAKDNPGAKARMRDLQEQQEQARRELNKLLDDIEDAADKLPDEADLKPLKQTAKKFADAVRKSEANTQMTSAETALGDFQGQKGAMFAKQAATTLENFIGQCKGMGEDGEAGVCLKKFQPTLSSVLDSTIGQLLGNGEGNKPGMGAGGRGGYSARRSSLKNVGLYGSMTSTAATASKTGDGRAQKGTGAHTTGDPGHDNPDGNAAATGSEAKGENDPAVPPQYRKRVGDYFRRVADELEQ